MKFLKKLNNPFLLAAEGFVAGAILFWATAPDATQARAQELNPVPALLSVAKLR